MQQWILSEISVIIISFAHIRASIPRDNIQDDHGLVASALRELSRHFFVLCYLFLLFESNAVSMENCNIHNVDHFLVFDNKVRAVLTNRPFGLYLHVRIHFCIQVPDHFFHPVSVDALVESETVLDNLGFVDSF